MYIASLEDDLAQAKLITQTLADANFQCDSFTTGKALLAKLAKPHSYDLLLLDWEVPDVSGLDVLRWVRANLGHRIPVLFLTSRTAEEDLVVGLQAGADDYMTKPLRKGELIARIHALLRRTTPDTAQNESFQFACYHIYPEQGRIDLNNEPITLAPKEFELALLLFRNPGRLFSRDVLSSAVWNREIPATSRTLDTHLSNIRRKLQLRPENGVRLSASYALGYRLEPLSDPLESS
ncbi:response regulator transcription factor [Alcaligenes endophyticus]|uniref:Response regulator transcription factor n=1 Tax=Alcaligenes endophyticus TaxID=1929088 RepID=A0ABT8EEZ1_9BURK|nr:response regulator transcription factor [Alcaligenes endophyticus]MCX5592826.1 response regulator transcription factor [Alcaligenes endophyticus]MDN4119823.1 response regulator transcription factor [Alcaligenes endophyticus]